MPVSGDKNVDSSLQYRRKAKKRPDFGLHFPFLVTKKIFRDEGPFGYFIPLISGRPLI
jgi:hypothetical protein